MSRWIFRLAICGALILSATDSRSEDDPMLKRLQALEKSFQRFRAERDAFQAQLQEKQKALDDALNQVRDAERRIRAAEKQAGEAEERRAELDLRLGNALRDLAAARQAADESEQRLRAAEKDRETLSRGAGEQSKAAAREAEAWAKERKELETRIAALEATQEEQRDRRQNLENQVSSLESALTEAARGSIVPPTVPPPAAEPAPEPEAPEGGAAEPVSVATAPASAAGEAPPALPPSPRQLALDRARSLRDARRMDEAVEAYRAWIKSNADDLEAVMELAALQQRAGRLDEARKTLDGLGRKAPPSPDLWLLRGRIEHDAGRLQAARAAYEKALSLNARHLMALKELAILLKAEGRTSEAIRMLERAREANPDDGEVLFNLSALLLMSNPPNVKEAEPLYRRALMLGEERDEQIERRLSIAP